MGMILPSSIMDKIRRGEPLDEAEVRYIRMAREHSARYALPLPVLLGTSVVLIGVLVYMTAAALSLR